MDLWDLPNEILEPILSYLTVKDMHGSLPLVSRRWHEISRQKWDLVKSMQIHVREGVHSDFFGSLFIRHATVRKIELLVLLSGDIPVEFFEALKLLNHLTAMKVENLYSTANVWTPDQLNPLIDNCPTLTDLHLPFCDGEGMSVILSRLGPQLRSFTCQGIYCIQGSKNFSYLANDERNVNWTLLQRCTVLKQLEVSLDFTIKRTKVSASFFSDFLHERPRTLLERNHEIANAEMPFLRWTV